MINFPMENAVVLFKFSFEISVIIKEKTSIESVFIDYSMMVKPRDRFKLQKNVSELMLDDI